MLVIQQEGDAFKLAAGGKPPALAHGVNTIGVMGAGFAVAVKKAWPDMFAEYEQQCKKGFLIPGGAMIWNTPKGGWVYNLASQDKPGKHATLDWLRMSVEIACYHAKSKGIREIVAPKIGCGYGGLKLEDTIRVLEEIESPVIWRIALG